MLKFLRYTLRLWNGQSAPVEMAPFEILSYIFELARGEEVIDLEARPKSILPVIVSHVSSHFRRVAIGTPTLWAVIRVYSLKNTQLDYLKTCLERSGTAPLSILLDLASIHSSGPAIAQVTSLIQANSHRLQRLTALKNSRSVLGNPLILFEDDMDNLTELRLCRVPISWSPCNLRNLSVLSLLSYNSNKFGLGCHEFWALIKSSPSLRKLCLSNSDLLVLSPTSSTVELLGTHKPFMLNSLEELQLIDISSDSSSTLISRLHAPNLKSLILHSTRNDHSGFFDQILGPPVLFPNLIFLFLMSVCVSNDIEVIARLQCAFSGLRKWHIFATFIIHPNRACVHLFAESDEHLFDRFVQP